MMDPRHIATPTLMSTLIEPTSMGKTDVHTHPQLSGSSTDDVSRESTAETKPPSRASLKKYNHLFAIHSTTKVTILSSQDAEKAPSFVGFRNLMVLMLCKASMASDVRVERSLP
jgi:hypothetical protein